MEREVNLYEACLLSIEEGAQPFVLVEEGRVRFTRLMPADQQAVAETYHPNPQVRWIIMVRKLINIGQRAVSRDG